MTLQTSRLKIYATESVLRPMGCSGHKALFRQCLSFFGYMQRKMAVCLSHAVIVCLAAPVEDVRQDSAH